MLDMKDLYWLAGFLEGEGTFIYSCYSNGLRTGCRITVASTDLDVISRAHRILGTTNKINVWQPGEHKTRYTIQTNSDVSPGWLMTLYPLMGERRRAKIRELIFGWKSHKKWARQPGKYDLVDRRRRNENLLAKVDRILAEEV